MVIKLPIYIITRMCIDEQIINIMEDRGDVARDKIFTKIMFPMLKPYRNNGFYEIFHMYSDINKVNMFCVSFCVFLFFFLCFCVFVFLCFFLLLLSLFCYGFCFVKFSFFFFLFLYFLESNTLWSLSRFYIVWCSTIKLLCEIVATMSRKNQPNYILILY